MTAGKSTNGFAGETSSLSAGMFRYPFLSSQLAQLSAGEGAAEFLLYQLTYVRHLPESAPTHNDVVYVLGGTPG